MPKISLAERCQPRMLTLMYPFSDKLEVILYYNFRAVGMWPQNKNVQWLWSAEWKFHHYGNHWACAEKFFRVLEFFNFAPNNHYGALFCILFLRQLHWNFLMRYFISITLKYLLFRSQTVRFVSLRLTENDAKTDIMTSKRHTDVMHANRLTPLVLNGISLHRSVAQKFQSGMQELFSLHV